MLPVKFGIEQSPIDLGEYRIKCPSCESDQWTDILVLSNYYYFFFIPVFPVSKEANIVCKKCGLRRSGATFDSKLISNYEEVKSQYRHPWFTYIGIVVLLLPIFIGLAFLLFT